MIRLKWIVTFFNDLFVFIFFLSVTNIFIHFKTFFLLFNFFFLLQTNLLHTIPYNTFLTSITREYYFRYMFMSRLTAVYTAAIFNEYL